MPFLDLGNEVHRHVFGEQERVGARKVGSRHAVALLQDPARIGLGVIVADFIICLKHLEHARRIQVLGLADAVLGLQAQRVLAVLGAVMGIDKVHKCGIYLVIRAAREGIRRLLRDGQDGRHVHAGRDDQLHQLQQDIVLIFLIPVGIVEPDGVDRLVGHERPSIAVQDLAARGRDHIGRSQVPLRLQAVGLAVDDLQ